MVRLILILFILFIPLQAKADVVYLKASWYSVESLKKEGTYKYSKGVMANGKVFKDEAFTCATRLYSLGTKLLITRGTKSVVVTCTDRIGIRFAKTRIDLSKRAFVKIANLQQGVVSVKVEEVKK